MSGTVCKLLTPKVYRSYREISFREKGDLLTEKIQNFAAKGFDVTWIHAFLSSFAEIGTAEVTKRVRGIHREKVGFAPFSGAFLMPHPSAKFCQNPSSFRGDIPDI